jgi:hypothetical protein
VWNRGACPPPPRVGREGQGFVLDGSGKNKKANEVLEAYQGFGANPEGEVKTMRHSFMLSILLPLSILAATVVATASRSPAYLSAPVELVSIPGAVLSPWTLRHLVAQQVVGNPDVGTLIPRRPVLGGTWFVDSAKDVRFVAPGVVALDYEDGHLAGRLIVLEDRPQ